MKMEIRALELSDIERTQLVTEAQSQGYNFIDRLIREWKEGKNRFDKAGELLLGVYVSDEMIALGGLNQDPYLDLNVGRLRHLFVLKEFRRQGVAKALIFKLLKGFDHYFKYIRLRVFNVEAAKFYEAIGFSLSEEADATHALMDIKALRS